MLFYISVIAFHCDVEFRCINIQILSFLWLFSEYGGDIF